MPVAAGAAAGADAAVRADLVVARVAQAERAHPAAALPVLLLRQARSNTCRKPGLAHRLEQTRYTRLTRLS